MKKTTLKKMADFLIDVAKYVLTAALVMSFLGEFGEKKLLYYGLGTLVVIVCLSLGFLITNKIDDTEK